MTARIRHGVAALLAAVLLAACGGGSGSAGGDTPPPGSQIGSLSLGLAGGAPGAWRHVWVTVDAVALHTDADRPWSPGDSTWQVLRLDAPVTIDLAGSVNGLIASLLTGRTLPAGSYGQMRLFVLRHDDALAASAQGEKLAFNAQAEWMDPAGTLRTRPLEFADAGLGLRLGGPITVSATESTELAIQWDLDRSLVRFAADDAVERVTMRPDLRVYDLAQTGAIIGLMDKSVFCPEGVRTGCVYDVVATAQRSSAEGQAMESVRSAPVVVGETYAAFALYPLPAVQAGETFDVVIRGRNMRTMVVRAVPAMVADLFQAIPTQLGTDRSDPDNPVAAPLVAQLSAQGDSQVQLAAPASPRSARIVFGQTLGSGELPHEVLVANTDPFSGVLAAQAVLPSGPLQVATFVPSGVLSFADVTPQEGADGYSVFTVGTRYEAPSAPAPIAAPGGSSVPITAPPAVRRSGIATGTLGVGIDVTAGKYDAAQLVVSDVGGIVTTQDISSLIGNSGAQAVLQLPAGANAAALGGTAVYAVAVRAWHRSDPSGSLQWGRASSPVDLRSTTSATTTVRVP